MRDIGWLTFLLLGAVVALPPLGAAEPPAWAYPLNPPASGPVIDLNEIISVPESPVRLTRQEIAAIGVQVPDWHPDEHPVMPAIVGRGRAPAVYACGYCHLPNGAGRPENASLAGLTVTYIKQQMSALASGERRSSTPTHLPQALMTAGAKAASEAEIADAAAYFASLNPVSFVRVVETETVPRTMVAGWMLALDPRGGTEPIGRRIVEMADDFERFEHRDSRTTYLALVPPGSIRRGAELAATGDNGRTVACVACHGPELRGLADVPRLAGRSPSYLMRQLYDLQQGARKGGAAELMKPVVMNLTEADMIALAAYLASLAP